MLAYAKTRCTRESSSLTVTMQQMHSCVKKHCSKNQVSACIASEDGGHSVPACCGSHRDAFSVNKKD